MDILVGHAFFQNCQKESSTTGVNIYAIMVIDRPLLKQGFLGLLVIIPSVIIRLR